MKRYSIRLVCEGLVSRKIETIESEISGEWIMYDDYIAEKDAVLGEVLKIIDLMYDSDINVPEPIADGGAGSAYQEGYLQGLARLKIKILSISANRRM